MVLNTGDNGYKQRKLKALYVCGSLTLICGVLSFINSSWQIIFPTVTHIFFVTVALLILYVLLYIYAVKGVKLTCFILIPSISCFLILEAGTRIWVSYFLTPAYQLYSPEQLKNPENLGVESVYVPNHYTLYNLRPNLVTREGTIHNSIGLRDHRSLNSKDKNLRIVFIGGSTTYTIGIKDNKKIFTAGLEQRLNEHYRSKLGGISIQVINAGMGGATSAENLLRLIFMVSEVSPDIVVIQHGLNDVWTRITSEPVSSDFSNYRKSWGKPENNDDRVFNVHTPVINSVIFSILSKSKTIVYLFRSAGYLFPQYRYHDSEQDGKSNSLWVGYLTDRQDVKTDAKFLHSNSPKYFERNTRYMIAICRALGAQVVLASEPYTEKAGEERFLAMPEHNALLAKIAHDENIRFFDFYREMVKNDDYMPDGRHMSQLGSDLKCELFYKYFTENINIPMLLDRLQKKLPQ